MNKERRSFFSGIFILGTALIAVYCILSNFSGVTAFLKKILGVFSPVIYGFCIAYVVNIFMSPFEKLWDKIVKGKKTKLKEGIKRAVCLILSLSLILGVFAAILLMIIPELTKTVTDLFGLLPGFISDVESFFSTKFEKYNISLPHIQINTSELQSTLFEVLPKIGTNFVNTTILITSSIFSAVIDTVVIIVLAIYMLIQKEALCRGLKKLLYAVFKKEHADKTMDFLELSNQIFTNFIRGQIVEAFIIGILCFIGMTILNIPYAMVVSVLIAVTALIPVLGAYIGAFVGAFLIVIISPIKALWFLIFIVVLQQLEGNLIYPKVVGKSVGLPGIFVLIAVTVGGSLFGVAGMLIGVPLTSVLYTVTGRFANKRIAEKHIIIK